MWTQTSWQLVQQLIKNPPLWSLLIGIPLRELPLPAIAEQVLQALAWTVIFLSLVLIGLRLSKLTSWQSFPACQSLLIKMVLIPLMLGIGLSVLGVDGPPRLVLVLQMAMPPVFATLVLTEAYELTTI